MAYEKDLIDALLRQADIVDVCRHYLPDVVKKGRNYAAKCPFHDDHDPSLSINPELKIYKCFVCGHGGNAIHFVQEFEKCSYPEAIRRTADIVAFHDPRLLEAVPMVQVDPEKQRLFDCIADLHAYYRYALETEEGKIAKDYLATRNLDARQQEKYGIGYAPSDGAKTIAYLQAKGYSFKNIEDIGIAYASEGMRDRNAGRLIFPLWDSKGRVVGFSARQLIRDPSSGKYMNSPETKIFHKGDVLYNYHNAAISAHRDGYCYVLEGFMDVIALDKANIPNAIALMGTALTKEQVKLLKKLKCEIRLCLDGDNAGQTGMMRAIKELSAGGVPFKIVDYGADLRDPDDILQEDGNDALVAKMTTLIDVVDFQLSYYLNVKKISSSEDKQRIIRYFAPLLAKENDIERENHIAKLSKALDYDPSALRLVLSRYASTTSITEDFEQISFANGSSGIEPGPSSIRRLSQRLAIAEDTILYYLMSEKEAREYLTTVDNPLFTTVHRAVANYIIEYASTHPEVDAAGLMAYIDTCGSDEDGTARNIVAEVAAPRPSTLPYTKEHLTSCVSVIEEEKKAAGEERKAQKALETGDPALSLQAIMEAAMAKRNGKKKK